jgi:hypothetical protein
MDKGRIVCEQMRTVQDGWRTVYLEGEHTVVHDGQTGGDRLVIPWADVDRISDDDIGA